MWSLDMYCYRRRGHNEGDEPRFTQPLMYQQIDQRPTVHESYTEHLVSLGELTQEEAEAIRRSREQYLEEEYGKLAADEGERVGNEQASSCRPMAPMWAGPTSRCRRSRPAVADGDPAAARPSPDYGLPADFNVHPKSPRC